MKKGSISGIVCVLRRCDGVYEKMINDLIKLISCTFNK